MDELNETKPKTPEDQWKEFMPPDDFVPEWKKQFRAMEKEVARKTLADRMLFAVIGFGVATALSLVPNSIQYRGALFIVIAAVAAWGWITSLLNKLKAVELDNKLNESIRIEEPKKEEKPQSVTEAKA
jgi:hypothetical protein